MQLWGNGEGGGTAEDCERIWREGKRGEKSLSSSGGAEKAPATNDFFAFLDELSSFFQKVSFKNLRAHSELAFRTN